MPIDSTAFIHPLAFVCGDVSLGARASVWPFAVLRGDTDQIVIGAESNVQDGAIIHVDAGVPTTLGSGVAVGHRAIVHGATVGDGALIGIGSVVLNGVHVGAGSIVGAGALCPEGMRIPEGVLVVGVPARVVRPLTPADRERVRRTVAGYVALQARHREGEFPSLGSLGMPR